MRLRIDICTCCRRCCNLFSFPSPSWREFQSFTTHYTIPRSSIMASATQTDSAPHLRASAAKNQEQKNGQGQQQESGRIPPPESSLVEDHFFWTYTEEPHRSRRQAIIKAHPEVGPPCYSKPTPPLPTTCSINHLN